MRSLPTKIHPLQRLLRYAKPYRPQVWAAVIYTILNQICDLAPPYLIGIAVDVVVQQENSLIADFGINNIVGQLAIVSLLTLLVWSLESLFQYLYGRKWRNLAQTLQHSLRIDTYIHLQELELNYFEERSTGVLLSILNDDINQLERFLDSGAVEILQIFTIAFTVGISFILVAPVVAPLTILPIPLILWGSFAFQKLLAPRYADVREKAGLINSRLANNIPGMATIKSFTAQNHEKNRVIFESEAYRRSNRKAIALSAAFFPLIRFVVVIGFIATLFFGGIEVANNRLSVGTYGFMVFIVQQLLWPFASLSEVMDEYQRAMASINRVMGLLDTPVAIRTGNRSLPLSEVRGKVKFDNIIFAYNNGNNVLKNLSLEIPPGANIGIVGATGSGKSTLVKLLLRFYETQAGFIFVDDINIRELNLEDLRRCIGWVSQDVFLFHGTVAENIAYGSFDVTHSEIIQAAKSAEAHEFIEALPQGYNTIIGERGQKLSGGQRQRLAIARAILKDPPILILDEATSAVDNETEAAIQKSLTTITKNRTTIAIAHRLSTIRNADCIYVMERGQLVEAGKHEDLVEKNTIYANLWRVQSGVKLG
ncbi:MAG: ABC transporter ATP-binding protein [Richelia sp. RM1_1_1]|nr:ABC transporter ATP-binding protein [Richelia sp. RM1_1_1]